MISKSPRQELSKAAFLALGKLGEKEALPYLEAKLEDNRPGISEVAKIAISLSIVSYFKSKIFH